MNITFTPKLKTKLKRRYNKAIKIKEEQFIFEGHEILTAYAGYLLQYLDMVLKKV